ncbi:hypothetical protein V2J09_022291 [Rumex salicifolius]
MDKTVENKTKKQQNLPADPVNSNQHVTTTRQDILSKLPNDILCNIISLLPLESAASTRLLSTQWSTLWSTTTTLKKHGIIEDASKELTNFLSKLNWVNLLRSPLKLEFCCNEGSILRANTGAKHKLHLNFSLGSLLDEEDKTQSSRFFLDLELNSSRYGTVQPPFLVKSLYLTSISRHLSDTISSLVSTLPFLERIEIKDCESLFCLRIHGGTKLEQLTIVDCPELGSLSVLAHALKSFKYKGRYPDTCVMGISDCKEMALDYRQGPGYEEFRRLSSHSLLLLYLKDAEQITLCQWTFEVMIQPRICTKEKSLRFSELKELHWIDSSVEEEKIESLMCFLQICPSLENLFITIDPSSYSLPRKRKESGEVPPGISKQLHHLKMVKLKGFKSQEEEAIVTNRILGLVKDEPVIVSHHLTRKF